MCFAKVQDLEKRQREQLHAKSRERVPDRAINLLCGL